MSEVILNQETSITLKILNIKVATTKINNQLIIEICINMKIGCLPHIVLISRPSKCHAFCVRHMQFDTFSHSHGWKENSHALYKKC